MITLSASCYSKLGSRCGRLGRLSWGAEEDGVQGRGVPSPWRRELCPSPEKNEYLLLKLVGSRSLHGKGHFGGCLAHWKALGVPAAVCSKGDQWIIHNGPTFFAMWPFVEILWPLVYYFQFTWSSYFCTNALFYSVTSRACRNWYLAYPPSLPD